MELERSKEFVDDYHGIKVADPYRWLEDPDSSETLNWVKEQNRVTTEFLNTCEAREKIKQRLTKLWDFPKYSAPYRKGDNRYFFMKNDGLQDQFVFYMQHGLDGDASVVIDPNTLSDDGTVALTNRSVSKDGTLVAYGLSYAGSDWQEVMIRQTDTGKDYDEVLKRCRYARIAWKHDNSGFYYNRFPDLDTVSEEDQFNYCRVYWHRLGTPQSEDSMVFEQPDMKELGFLPIVTDDGKYLVLHVYHGTDTRNRLYFREAESDGPFIRLLDEADAYYGLIDNVGSVFYFETDLDAPRGRIIAIDVENPARENWKEILPEREDVLSHVTMVNNQMVVAYMHNAHHLLKLYDLDGTFVRDIEVPSLGTVGLVSGKRHQTDMFIMFTSFLFPTSIYRYDFTDETMRLFRGPDIDFNPAQFEAHQVFYTSRDGTRVPMFIVHKKGISLDGSNPALLTGYGGFRISLTPFFSLSNLVWMEQGGVFAVANLRGGGEYGEIWHQEGMLGRKQNVFDDFIAAGEWLIENDYTCSERLAISGGSNGGLLVAACLVQRPELFGAVLCSVPVIDMLRYHRFSIGRYWEHEYGNAEKEPEHFRFLYAYSPLHNITNDVAYPPTLIATADTDDRVVPAHGKKFAAALQEAHRGSNPLLLRVETKAGHGIGKPTTKIIEEISDRYAFLFRIFNLKYANPG